MRHFNLAIHYYPEENRMPALALSLFAWLN